MLRLNSIPIFQEDDARIIIGGFYEDKAREVFCEASTFKSNSSTR